MVKQDVQNMSALIPVYFQNPLIEKVVQATPQARADMHARGDADEEKTELRHLR